jgi:hypothetical protein
VGGNYFEGDGDQWALWWDLWFLQHQSGIFWIPPCLLLLRSLLQLPALTACCFCACKVCSCVFLTTLVDGPHIHSSRYLPNSRFHWILTNLQACL